jgi:hypothetical protein
VSDKIIHFEYGSEPKSTDATTATGATCDAVNVSVTLWHCMLLADMQLCVPLGPAAADQRGLL